jgi:hypothetical protein
MIRLFEVLTWIGAVLGAIMLGGGLSNSTSAPQQAAAAGIAIALVAIPYMLQRRQMLKEMGKRRLASLDFTD